MDEYFYLHATRYEWLSFCQELCTVPEEILNKLLEDRKYFISHNEVYVDFANYKAWRIHAKENNESKASLSITEDLTPWIEINDILWNDINTDILHTKHIIEYFSNFVTNITKYAYGTLNANGVIELHPGHHLPRIHIPLNKVDIEFGIVDRDLKEHVFNLEFGKAYVTNVCYPHYVKNISKIARHGCYFCFDGFTTQELKDKFTIA